MGPLRIKEGTGSDEFQCELLVDKKGNFVMIPDKTRLKIYYERWRDQMKSYGMDYDYALLDSADFGAYTSRLRYFGIFAKYGFPICIPEKTHSKKPTPGKKKWKAVREVLKLEEEGTSIFGRKKPLVENTLARIYHGLVKFSSEGTFRYRNNGGSVDPQEKSKTLAVPMGTILSENVHCIVKSVFLKKYYSGRPEGKVIGVDCSAGTLTCIDGQAIVSAFHLETYYGNGGQSSIEEPCPTLTTKDRVCVVNAHFLDKRYGTGVAADIEKPADTLTTVPKLALVNAQFIDQQYGQSKPTSIDIPLNTQTCKDKFSIVTAKPWIMNTNFQNVGSDLDSPLSTITASRHYHYLLNPQYESKGSSIEKPCFTLIARMDKRLPYMISTETGEGIILIYDTDSPMMVKIKEFMAENGIVDVKMRMLLIEEMLRIQGFPEGYELKGTQTDQKKFIGNSVVPLMALKACRSKLSRIETIITRSITPTPTKPMITEKSKDDVKNADIVRVIGNFLELKRAGANYVAKSPFSEDKTPSLTVFKANNNFKDYSSGIGGDSIEFVMRHKGVDFVEALRIIAGICDIVLVEEEVSEEEQRKRNQKQELHAVMAIAVSKYRINLHNQKSEHWAKQILKLRGINEETLTKFSIGYSPENAKFLSDPFVASAKFAEAKACGLVMTKEGRNFDFFRYCVMFPIQDFKGNFIGFGARRSDEATGGKYINSD
ncbi:CHC2 zinc finger domain-containing protein [Flavobacterium sp. 3HN19-14]|uniref:CHC2 zinc finger domain-containing protein n=1 Tax=Flavobacterium sp. 3HN19-14 TaxID=3448133 RepID=UPI003EDE7CC7